MVITFATILIGLLFLVKMLQRNPFYIMHAMIVILSAYFVETYYFRTSIFSFKTILLFVVFHIISINIVTVLAYYLDKRAATRRDWRVSEKNLHSLEFLGGWIGALFAQRIFNHKSKKKSYQSMFWFLGFAQIVAVLIILRFLKFL